MFFVAAVVVVVIVVVQVPHIRMKFVISLKLFLYICLPREIADKDAAADILIRVLIHARKICMKHCRMYVRFQSGLSLR